MPRNTEYKIETDVKKALADLQNMATKFQEIDVKIGNMGKTAQKTKKETEDLGKSVEKTGQTTGRAGQMVIGMVSSFMSLQGVISLITRLEDRLDSVTQKSENAARGLKPLLVQLAGLPGGPAERKSIEQMGAAQGLTSEQISQVGNPLKSIQGSNMSRDFPVAAMLSNMGADSKSAADIVQAGIVRGMGSSRSGGLVVAASDQAPWGVPEVARTIPETLQYSSLETGLAAGVALRTGGVESERIPAALRAGARALRQDESKLSKKFGLKGLSETERASKLYAAAQASGDFNKFTSAAYMQEKFGLGEEEGSAVGMLIRNSGKFRMTEAGLKASGSGQLEQRWSELLGKNPDVKAEFESRVAQESFGYSQRYGSQAEEARKFQARRQAIGIQLEKSAAPGDPMRGLGTNDNGEANWWGRTVNWLNSMDPGRMGEPETPTVRAAREARIDPEAARRKESATAVADPDNTKATQKNTDALERLRQAIESKGTTPKDRNAGL